MAKNTDKDSFDIEFVGANHNKKTTHVKNYEVTKFLDSRVIPDFTGDAVVKIPKPIFDGLNPNGTRWEALQKWLIHRDSDLIVSHALDFVKIVFEDGRAGTYQDDDGKNLEYDESDYKSYKEFIVGLSKIYTVVFDSATDAYKLSLKEQITDSLLHSDPFVSIIAGHDKDVEDAQKQINNLNSQLLKKQKLVNSLSDEVKDLNLTIEKLKSHDKELTASLSSVNDHLLASQKAFKGLEADRDNLLSLVPKRVLKKLYNKY